MVLNNGKVVFASNQASTLPDRPFDAKGNDRTDVGTLLDGKYNVANHLHNNDYPALNVKKAYALRIHSESHPETSAYIGTSDYKKCPKAWSDGATEAVYAHPGINIHRTSLSSSGSVGSTPGSAGCLNIHKSDYDKFAAAVGFAYIAERSR